MLARSDSIVRGVLLALAATLGFGGCADRPAFSSPTEPSLKSTTTDAVRFATFNASLNRNAEGQLVTDLSTPGNAQARTVAEIIQRNHPDVLLINEFDFVAGGEAARLFQENYLAVSQNGAEPITYPYRFVAPSNTGIPSGFDLDNGGTVGGGNDALGFGAFPGQFGMAAYSRYPIDLAGVRTFQTFLWKDMPGALVPDDAATPAPGDFYSPAELGILRLSSKSHWDLPLEIGGKTVHFLVSHPTPPGVRRSGGSERAPQLRRDPVLGRLRPAGRWELHLRRRGPGGWAGAR
jgi:hypothetical protein